MSASESAQRDRGFLFPGLAAGLDEVSASQTVTFTRYTRQVLPLDGFVFWLNTGQTICPKISIHDQADTRQTEAGTPAINRIVVTSEVEIEPFNQIQQTDVWIGTILNVRFAFSHRGYFYRSASLFHYFGEAVYPQMQSQLVDTLDELDTTALIVSNSLPAWLALAAYNPVWLNPPNPAITLYPSFLVPENLPPPYGAVHIEPSQTRAMQSAPVFDSHVSQYTLASDRVRVTLYGARNDAATAFLDLVNQFSRDTDTIGLMNMPIVRDDKETQNELNIIAQRKTIEFEVSYQQAAIRDLAWQLIKHAVLTFDAGYEPPSFVNDNGALAFLNGVAPNSWQTTPTDLTAGDVWDNVGTVAVVTGGIPLPGYQVRFGDVSPAQLLASGAGFLGTTKPPPGSELLWNNSGAIGIA